MTYKGTTMSDHRMPPVVARQQYRNLAGEPIPGATLMESDDMYVRENSHAAVWALDNVAAINVAMDLAQAILDHQHNPGAVAPYLATLARAALKRVES
jgi:glyoxylate utilization-related uncharacterized protein